MINAGEVRNRAELFAGVAGGKVQPKDVYRIIELVLRDAADCNFLTGVTEFPTADNDGDGSIDKVYELPSDVENIQEVHFKDCQIYQTDEKNVKRLQGNHNA